MIVIIQEIALKEDVIVKKDFCLLIVQFNFVQIDALETVNALDQVNVNASQVFLVWDVS